MNQHSMLRFRLCWNQVLCGQSGVTWTEDTAILSEFSKGGIRLEWPDVPLGWPWPQPKSSFLVGQLLQHITSMTEPYYGIQSLHQPIPLDLKSSFLFSFCECEKCLRNVKYLHDFMSYIYIKSKFLSFWRNHN